MSFAANAQAEINVTPLIDVLLVLLIIFMVIVPTSPHGLESAVPQGQAAAHTAELPPIVVEVLAPTLEAATRYRVNQHEVAPPDLAATLQAMLAVRESRTLFVQADRSLTFDRVADVVATAKQSGAITVSLQTSAQR